MELQKSTKMLPRSAPKATLEGGPQSGGRVKMKMEAFWCHLRDFGCHVGTQLGAKGLPKSSFLAPSPPKNFKNDVQGKVSEKS